MNDTTIRKIKAHLKLSEGEFKHPYLDIKGKVTAGVGFNVDRKSDFTALDFWTKDRDGTERRATPDEKSAAYDKMIAAREANKGDHNRKAKSYNGTTKVFLPEGVMEKTLDDKAREHLAGAQKDVGKDAWNRLNDSQKAAVTDIRYANGDLDDFTELTKAIQAGDAKKMADESTFYANSKTGQRDVGRLERNYEALSGLSQEESDKRLKEVLERNDVARKNNPIRNATPPVKPTPPQKPGGGAPDNGPDKPGASGDDGPSDGKGGSSDRGGDSSGEGQPQSANVTDPEAAPETKDFTPEQKKLMENFDKTDGPLDDILAKDPGDWTDGEFVEIKKAMIDLPAGPEQERLDEMATAFLDDKYGTGPVEYDAVGRMIDPEPKKTINRKPGPAKTPDGEPLRGALKRIGRVVAGAAGGEGSASAVQGLQSGLNLLKQVMDRSAKSSRTMMPGPDLKTDGVVGPKTRRTLRFATAKLGRPKIEEGFALGRFGRFARDVQTGRDDTRNLGTTIGKAFGPLFRPLGTALSKQGRAENVAFQATLNDLGPKVFEPDAFKPILEDGLIGPKTETAFNAVLPAAGPDRFTSCFGHNLGFFDFDDFG